MLAEGFGGVPGLVGQGTRRVFAGFGMVREFPPAASIGGKPECGKGLLEIRGAARWLRKGGLADGSMVGRHPMVFELAWGLCGRGSGSQEPGGTREGGGAFGDSVTD